MNALAENADLEARVLQVVSSCLGVHSFAIDPTAPLVRYGLDSLNALEVAEALTELTGRSVPSEALLDYPSVNALTRHLESCEAWTPSGPPVERMLADSVLPEDIVPCRGARACDGPLLLTGATGFLGIHLLAALLEQTAQDLICLVRAGSEEDAHARLRSTAARYCGGAPIALERVRVIAGDIEHERLGLPQSAYADLCESVSSVLHCAAAVDWSQRYDALRGPNVVGTCEAIRFAARGRPKPFHFISSVSVCYSTRRLDPVEDKRADAADPAGLHLGYAQSKWVAEALVREAGARGLETAIYRPGLIAGHSESGISNNDDLLARLVRGCIELGAAPDVAWRIDACPVDYVAAAVARLLRSGCASTPVHLLNPRSGRWPEAVLWMNLLGYRVRLVPFALWLELVEAHARNPHHPLHALRSFLFDRPLGEGGRYLAEVYADPQVVSVDDRANRDVLDALGVTCPSLGPSLLQTWFDGYVRSGHLAAPPRMRKTRHGLPDFALQLEGLFRAHEHDPRLQLDCVRPFTIGGDNSILGELACWHAGSALGMHGCTIEATTGCGTRRSWSIVIKPKPADEAVFDVACEVAALFSERLRAAFEQHWKRTSFAGTAAREIALYAGPDPHLLSCMPRSYGVLDWHGQRSLVLEHVADLTLNDAAHADRQWRREHVEAALSTISRVHAMTYGCADELRIAGTLRPVLDASAVRESEVLWMELAEHARPWIASWAGSAAARSLIAAARSASERAAELERLPRCVVHHDFNPRNIGFRMRDGHATLCVLDWELATHTVPQRDLAELLCFVLPGDASAELVWHYVEFHRRALERASGLSIERADWVEGFGLALQDFAVQRLTMYVIAHRLRGRPFLERVARAWMRLLTAAEGRSSSQYFPAARCLS